MLNDHLLIDHSVSLVVSPTFEKVLLSSLQVSALDVASRWSECKTERDF